MKIQLASVVAGSLASAACGQSAAGGSVTPTNGASAASANQAFVPVAALPAGDQLATPAPPASAPAIGPLAYLRGQLAQSTGTRIATAEADLNGDGMNEFIVYAAGPDQCGSGGCRVVALTARGGAWHMVMDASVSRLPIRLLDTSTNGWRDLAVTIGGGGLGPGLERMKFNGTSYPDNPTIDPAEDIDPGSGTVLIAEDAPLGALE